ncbi:MAG: macrolide-efflux protein [Symbiobacteriaceae bacterium]|jgi:MFS family permease|nr:macrolide-efflux protein [Symbiobacteriaceae bacterium]
MNSNSRKNWMAGMSVFLVLGIGHFLTLLGSAMTRFAFGVWTFETTGRVQDFATVLVIGFLPGILLSPLVGVWIDRKGPRLMVLAGDLIGALAMATVLPAVLADSFTYPHLLIITAVLSCASALQGPAMPALIPTIVPEAKVAQANGFFTSLTAASDVLGPVLAGILLTMGALPVVVGFDLITFGAAILITLVLWAKLATGAAAGGAEAGGEQSSMGRELREGWRYLMSGKPLMYLVMLFAFVNFGIAFLGVLVPPFTLTMGTAQDFGFVNGAWGLGMVLGGLIMTIWKTGARKIPLILWSIFLFGAAIAAGGFARIPLLLGFAVGTASLIIPIVNTLVVTLLQVKSKPSHLGRVFAMARMMAWISMPVGQVLAGFLADSQLVANAQAMLPDWLLGTGKHGVYGLMLLCTGTFLILTIAGFSRVKSLSTLDEEGPLEAEVA